MTYTRTMQTKSANAMAQLNTNLSVYGRKIAAQAFVDAMQNAIERGRDAGIDDEVLEQWTATALDLVGDIVIRMNRDLDNENIYPDATVDVSELKALVEKCK